MDESSHSCGATETHFSWVFFTPDRAYKLLRPVAMPFIARFDHLVDVEPAGGVKRRGDEQFPGWPRSMLCKPHTTPK